MNRHILAAALAATLVSTRVSAQVSAADVQNLAPGTRVRVSSLAAEEQEIQRRVNNVRWTVGTVREVTPGALVLQTNPSNPEATVAIPLNVIQAVDVSRGRLDVGNGMRRGLITGATVGGVTAGTFVLIILATHQRNECDRTVNACDLPQNQPQEGPKAGTAAAIVGGG
ncbi:MAG TPA: hypothetical protein VF541_20625, partial [Longimicrobium sp.]